MQNNRSKMKIKFVVIQTAILSKFLIILEIRVLTEPIFNIPCCTLFISMFYKFILILLLIT